MWDDEITHFYGTTLISLALDIVIASNMAMPSLTSNAAQAQCIPIWLAQPIATLRKSYKIHRRSRELHIQSPTTTYLTSLYPEGPRDPRSTTNNIQVETDVDSIAISDHRHIVDDNASSQVQKLILSRL